MVRIPSSGTCTVHKSGIWSCSSNPTIGVSFDISFWRNSDSFSTLRWSITNTNLSSSNANFFNYNFYVYVGVDSPDTPYDDSKIWSLVRYDAQTKTPWYNYISKKSPTGYCTNTSTTGKAKVKIYVQGGPNGCCNGNNNFAPCYPGNFWHKITEYEVDVPKYEETYTITYDANGGQNAPAPQTKSSLSPLTLSSQIPTYPLNVTYNYDTVIIDQIYRTFNYWREKWTTNTYSPGGTFDKNADTTLVAEWGKATLVPAAIPDKYVTVTFNANGGSVTPPSASILREALGYDTSASATTVVYVPGTSYNNISSAVSLYPIYGNATLRLSDMPGPVKPGANFGGWYLDSQLTNPITDDSPLVTNTDVTVYAKWDALPLYKFENNQWTNIGPYVWRFSTAESAWNQTYNTYKFVDDHWVDLVEAPQPADVFNHGSIVGLNPYYAEELVNKYSQASAQWIITTDSIYRNNDGQSILTFGGVCDRGNFTKLCIDCEIESNTYGPYNECMVGLRWQRKGRGTSYNSYMDYNLYLTNYQTQTNYDHTTPWYQLSRQIVVLDLNKIVAQPIYIGFTATSCKPKIYSMWFE